MAEKKKPKAAKPAMTRSARTKSAPAKKAKAATAKRASAKKPAPAAKRKPAPRRPGRSTSSGFDLVKLIDHPLVADLLAVGAMAAVAAIADHSVKTRTGESESGSSKAVKAAGKAAAAAIGKRLLTEVEEIRKVGEKKPKRGSR